MATIRAASNSVTTRAVHVKIAPRPRNIRESREVLRVLKSFGEVASFRNLRVRWLFESRKYRVD